MNIPVPEINLSGRKLNRKLCCPVLQSPLSGVSDQVFRNLVRRWAPEALLFTEMVNASSLKLGHGAEKVEELSKEKGPIGVQLFDYRPQAMVDAAIKAEEAGAFLIDINMGCPVKKVAKKGGGSGLLRDPDLASKIVKDVAKAIGIPVTVKMRLGWCEDTSDPINFALRMQDAGAQLLTLHGRTRKQGFKGKADWNAIAKVKQALSIPLIANGDINNADDAILCLKATGANGVMVGRGSMGAPWLVGQINCVLKGLNKFESPGPKTRVSIALEQLESLLESKGEHGLLIARKHLNWTCRGFPGASDLRYSLLRAETPSQARSLLQNQLLSLE